MVTFVLELGKILILNFSFHSFLYIEYFFNIPPKSLYYLLKVMALSK